MVNSNLTACGLAQAAANHQKMSNSAIRARRDWYRFYNLRKEYLTSDELFTLRSIALFKGRYA